jgi:NADPH-dependent curcumin reductase CurA
MTIPANAREFRLASRPDGTPTPANFDLATAPVPTPAAGQVLVRNQYLSVDPYMRGRMRDVKSYAPPYAVGEAMYGGAVGEVVASAADNVKVGDTVVHQLGWREYALVDAKAAEKVDPAGEVPLSAYLGTLGMPGLTAYVGVTRTLGVKEGDVVFVSGAAGAVGSAAGQMARLRGASRVIGSAGSAEKVRYLKEELGFDDAFDYHDGNVTDLLAAAAPNGIDAYFDNVGGDHLEAAINVFNVNGRAALCGSISGYNKENPEPGPRNLSKLVGWRLRLEGFLVLDHYDLLGEFRAEVGPWIRDGKLKYRETVVEGFENTAQAFIDMLGGANTGKMVVKL